MSVKFDNCSTNGNFAPNVSEHESSINNRDIADDANLIRNGSITIDVSGHGEVHFAGSMQEAAKPGNKFKRFMKGYCIAYMREYEGKINSEEIKMWPPPIAIPLITILETIFFVLQTGNESIWSYTLVYRADPTFVEDYFPYSPRYRIQIWRFITYMFVHGDWAHLTFNVFNQTVLGIPMEYISSWWRVSVIYLAGVLSGGLMASIIKPNIGLCGASTGGYALLAATVFRMHNLMRWRQMDRKHRMLELKNLLIYLIIFELPVLSTKSDISHSGHFFGALGGFLAGLVFLNNVDVTTIELEKKIKIAAGCVYLVLVAIPVGFHVFSTNYFFTYIY